MMFIDAELIAALVALAALAISGVYAFAKLGNRVDNLEREVKGMRLEVKELRDLVLMVLHGRGHEQSLPHVQGLMPPPQEGTSGS